MAWQFRHQWCRSIWYLLAGSQLQFCAWPQERATPIKRETQNGASSQTKVRTACNGTVSMTPVMIALRMLRSLEDSARWIRFGERINHQNKTLNGLAPLPAASAPNLLKVAFLRRTFWEVRAIGAAIPRSQVPDNVLWVVGLCALWCKTNRVILLCALKNGVSLFAASERICVAESTPTRPPPARGPERWLRPNQEKAWHRPPTTAMPVLSPQIAALFPADCALLRAKSCQRTRKPRAMTPQSRARFRMQQQEDGENHLISWRFLLSPAQDRDWRSQNCYSILAA